MHGRDPMQRDHRYATHPIADAILFLFIYLLINKTQKGYNVDIIYN